MTYAYFFKRITYPDSHLCWNFKLKVNTLYGLPIKSDVLYIIGGIGLLRFYVFHLCSLTQALFGEGVSAQMYGFIFNLFCLNWSFLEMYYIVPIRTRFLIQLIKQIMFNSFLWIL